MHLFEMASIICIVGEKVYLLCVHQSVSIPERMIPQKLSGTNLESILWNIVPVKLPTEVGNMADWSMQEIFQKVFQAKETVKKEKKAIANCLKSGKKGHLVRTCEEGQFVECFTKQLCRTADAEQLNKY